MTTLTERDILLSISKPDAGVIKTLSNIQGDLLMLGAGGKIGHGLALMAKRAFQEAGKKNKVLAVSRYTSAASRKALEDDGITTVPCDLSDVDAVAKLPDATDIIYLAGQKFGTADGPAVTWMLNTVVPGVVARRWPKARIAVYSSGNVYPFYPTSSAGPDESIAPGPIGEYAQSVLGRERIFEYYSRTLGTPITTIRLNYANEPRYGVLVDLANTILSGKPVDLTQGYVNVVSAGDCNRVTLKCLDIASAPPKLLNLAGPKITVKELGEKLGKALNKPVSFVGTPAANALLSNSDFCWKTFGPQLDTIDGLIAQVAQWLNQGGNTMGKPTHFEARDGKF